MPATRHSIFAAQTHRYFVTFRTLANPRLAARAMNFPSGEMRKVFAPLRGRMFGLLFGWCISRGSRCGSIFTGRRRLCLYWRGGNELLKWGCYVGAEMQWGDLWYRLCSAAGGLSRGLRRGEGGGEGGSGGLISLAGNLLIA